MNKYIEKKIGGKKLENSIKIDLDIIWSKKFG